MKSTVDEIRRRFDADVERFSNLDTGRPPDLSGSELFKEIGPLQPDSEGGLKTLARLLRPPLLVFVLSEYQNRPQYPPP